MKDQFIKTLLESGVLSEDSAQVINEAWETKLNEAREEVRSELRDEFATKYAHDRDVMVTALDKMVTEGLSLEISEFHEERKMMDEDRVKAQAKLRETASKFNDFMVTKLAEEIKELRGDRAIQRESQNKLEKFIVKALAGEIKEFHQDKRAVVEAKVKLVSEAKKQLESLKAKFIRESAKKMNVAITSHLKGELGQLKEDIKVARENNFGRRIFESFATEFSATHLNEKAETRKLVDAITQKDRQLAESAKVIAKAKVLVESKEREVRIIKESNVRQKALEELLSPLNQEKATVMRSLLESVQTSRLQAAFEKYLPAVLNTATEKSVSNQKQTISESVAVTGNKTVKHPEVFEDRNNVIDLKRLAGL